MSKYDKLIKDLISEGILKTVDIIDAFRATDRKNFVPEELKSKAWLNIPLPIGRGQTISQPQTVAFMLELLQVEPGNKVLEIGAGSGWQTALLAYLVGEAGRIFAVERIKELCNFGRENLTKADLFKSGRIELLCQDASSGLAGQAPFDRIIAAAAGETLPREWLGQLKVGGRLVAPVKNSIWLAVRAGEKKFETTEYPGFVFVLLIKGKKN